MLHHITLCYIISHYVTSQCIVSHYISLPHIVSQCITSHHKISHHATSHHISLSGLITKAKAGEKKRQKRRLKRDSNIECAHDRDSDDPSLTSAASCCSKQCSISRMRYNKIQAWPSSQYSSCNAPAVVMDEHPLLDEVYYHDRGLKPL